MEPERSHSGAQCPSQGVSTEQEAAQKEAAQSQPCTLGAKTEADESCISSASSEPDNENDPTVKTPKKAKMAKGIHYTPRRTRSRIRASQDVVTTQPPLVPAANAPTEAPGSAEAPATEAPKEGCREGGSTKSPKKKLKTKGKRGKDGSKTPKVASRQVNKARRKERKEAADNQARQVLPVVDASRPWEAATNCTAAAAASGDATGPGQAATAAAPATDLPASGSNQETAERVVIPDTTEGSATKAEEMTGGNGILADAQPHPPPENSEGQVPQSLASDPITRQEKSQQETTDKKKRKMKKRNTEGDRKKVKTVEQEGDGDAASGSVDETVAVCDGGDSDTEVDAPDAELTDQEAAYSDDDDPDQWICGQVLWNPASGLRKVGESLRLLRKWKVRRCPDGKWKRIRRVISDEEEQCFIEWLGPFVKRWVKDEEEEEEELSQPVTYMSIAEVVSLNLRDWKRFGRAEMGL